MKEKLYGGECVAIGVATAARLMSMKKECGNLKMVRSV